MALCGLVGCQSPSQPFEREAFTVFSGHLQSGFDLGVDDSDEARGWVDVADGEIRMEYPAGKEWGIVFLVTGAVTAPPRPSLDFSGFRALRLELRSDGPGAAVRIHLEDTRTPRLRQPERVWAPLSSEWRAYELPLESFQVDLGHLYVVTAFDFLGNEPERVDCRDIRFVR